MSELAAAPAFAGLHDIGGAAGVHVRLRALSLVSVLARKNASATLVEKARADFGLSLTDGPRRSSAGGVSALGIGPGRWLFLGKTIDDLASLAGVASLSDHSDGYAVFEMWGPDVLRALAKGVPLDLDPAAFTAEDAGVTLIAHIGAVIWRQDERYFTAVFRSFAGSFWHWLMASAAEFGLAVDSPS